MVEEQFMKSIYTVHGWNADEFLSKILASTL